ncbi:hypothetical protein R3P38DRAFT_3042320, partial [Favolaschia claudopus]
MPPYLPSFILSSHRRTIPSYSNDRPTGFSFDSFLRGDMTRYAGFGALPTCSTYVYFVGWCEWASVVARCVGVYLFSLFWSIRIVFVYPFSC